MGEKDINKCHLRLCVMSLNVHVWWVTWSDLKMHSNPSRARVLFSYSYMWVFDESLYSKASCDCSEPEQTVRALPQDCLLWARQRTMRGENFTPYSQHCLCCVLSVTLAHCNLGYLCIKSIYKPPWTHKSLQCVSTKWTAITENKIKSIWSSELSSELWVTYCPSLTSIYISQFITVRHRENDTIRNKAFYSYCIFFRLKRKASTS